MKIRREWGSLPPQRRKDFTDAVKCLMKKPSQLSLGEAPGAKSRYDDFTAIHINQTLHVHGDGIFLSWHRNYIHLFEQALATECGYKGTLPYWNWPLYVDNLKASPLFDGSPYSLSGDGEYDPSLPPIQLGGNFTLPRGSGGGCVTTGPFANMIVPFKRLDFSDVFVFLGVLPKWTLDYDPHCFKRDLNTYAAQYTNQANVSYLLQQRDVASFLYVMQGGPGRPPSVHIAGHISGGGSSGDLHGTFASPADPAFFLHHGMVDLMWTVWQARDPKNRRYALSGGDTFLNIPPSPNVTLDYVENWGILDEPRQIWELTSVTDGPFCYRYDYEY